MRLVGKFLPAAFALLCAFMLLSCGGRSEVETVQARFTFALQNEPDGYDPGITNNTFASPFMNQLFEGLVTYDANGEIIPGHAESWTISDDGRSYTFNLRRNLRWSNGEPLTAHDFEFAWFRVLDPGTGARFADMITTYVVGANAYYDGTGSRDAVGIKVIDDNTLQIELIEPTPFYLGILAMWTYSPVHRGVVEANPERWTMDPSTYIVNGPFKPVTIRFGEGIVMAKNEHYWDAANVRLEEINFRFILEPATALSAFERGEIDGFRTVPASDIPRLRTSSDAFHVFPSFGTTYYEVNNNRPPFNDPRVRNALSMALDRQDIIENVIQAPGFPTFGIVSPGYAFDGVDFTAEHRRFNFNPNADPERARQLLAEAGFPNGEGFPVIELSYYTDATVRRVVEAIQQMWERNLNVRSRIVVEDWAIYYARIQRSEYDIGAMGWGGDYLHPMTFLQLFTSYSINNNSGYANREYDSFIERTLRETDPGRAIELMHQAEAIFIRDQPVIPLFSRTLTIMVAPYVKNWALTALNNLYFRHAYIER